jgi:hypothetical protein
MGGSSFFVVFVGAHSFGVLLLVRCTIMGLLFFPACAGHSKAAQEILIFSAFFLLWQGEVSAGVVSCQYEVRTKLVHMCFYKHHYGALWGGWAEGAESTVGRVRRATRGLRIRLKPLRICCAYIDLVAPK